MEKGIGQVRRGGDGSQVRERGDEIGAGWRELWEGSEEGWDRD